MPFKGNAGAGGSAGGAQFLWESSDRWSSLYHKTVFWDTLSPTQCVSDPAQRLLIQPNWVCLVTEKGSCKIHMMGVQWSKPVWYENPNELVLKYDFYLRFKLLKGCICLLEIQGWENLVQSIAILPKHSAGSAFLLFFGGPSSSPQWMSKRSPLCAACLWDSITLTCPGTAPHGALCTQKQVQGTRKRDSALKTKTNVTAKRVWAWFISR